MTLNKNYKDITTRAIKTFIQAASAVLIVNTVGVSAALLVGVISALFASGTNLFNVSPKSKLGRALATFLQTFTATWGATGFIWEPALMTGALAAAISAAMNYVHETA